jgi:predicted DNA-binding ribbon-helix-helix protein
MASTIIKRSVELDGHKTSVSLEDEFWKVLKEIATARGMTLSGLIASIDRTRCRGNLSSALRLFILESYRDQAERRGGERAAA